MRNIEARCLAVSEKMPALGAVCCLATAVKGQGFSRYAISDNMNTLLVQGDDYEKEDRKELLEYLYKLSNSAEETKI